MLSWWLHFRYHTIDADPDRPLRSYMEYIDSLPMNADPEMFGLHPNANISCDRGETYDMFDILLSLQPRTATSGTRTREEEIARAVAALRTRLPGNFDLDTINAKFPVKYEESMNTVLVQECLRYNKLLAVMKATLKSLAKALIGQLVMSEELERLGASLYDQKVPALWEARAFPSLKPLAAWSNELIDRLDFVDNWATAGAPPCFWISGLFFPQAFLTGTLQNYARKYKLPIDTLSFDFKLLGQDIPTRAPADGSFIHGLFLEGARWDFSARTMAESRPKELYVQRQAGVHSATTYTRYRFTPLPVLHLVPMPNRSAPESGVYRCPVYKTLSRRGTLSTTGHSTNFVIFIELVSNRPSAVNQQGVADCSTWVKAGVAAFCALRY